MVKYRKGDKFLSKEEFYEEKNDNWRGGLFILGALVAGTAANHFLAEFEIVKWLRFVGVIFSSIFLGAILAGLQFYIRKLLSLVITISILVFIAYLIWNNI